MSINAFVHSYLTKDYHTQTLGTAIDEEIPGQNGKRLALVGLDYLCGATAQTLNILHCGDTAGSRTTTSASAVSGQKDIVATANPTDPAGNATASADIIAFQLVDGTWEFDTVSSLSTKTITMTNNIQGIDAGGGAAAVASGAKVRIFGVVGDKYSFVVGLKASTRIVFKDTVICQAPFMGDPLYVTNANGTAASFQNMLLFAYINK